MSSSSSAVKRSLRQFTFGTAKTAGRNSSGRITSFHRGGGAKRLHRTIDLKRNVSSSMGVVERIEYDPNRSSNIALIRWLHGVADPQPPRRRRSATAAELSSAATKLLEVEEPAATIRGAFAFDTVFPRRRVGTHARDAFSTVFPQRVGTNARDVFLSAFKAKGGVKPEAESHSLGVPRIAVVAAKPEFLAARAKGEEGLLQVRNWKRDSDAWKNRNKRKAAISWNSI